MCPYHEKGNRAYHVGSEVEDPINTLRNFEAIIQAAQVGKDELIAELALHIYSSAVLSAHALPDVREREHASGMQNDRQTGNPSQLSSTDIFCMGNCLLEVFLLLPIGANDVVSFLLEPHAKVSLENEKSTTQTSMCTLIRYELALADDVQHYSNRIQALANKFR